MNEFSALFESAFPCASTHGRQILVTIVRRHGRIESAEHFARSFGARNRHHLARQLKQAGLPPLETLIGWATVLHWVLEWEKRRTSLFKVAGRQARDPAVCYRRVRRVTGESWTEVRERGVAWVVVQMRDRFGTAEPVRFETTLRAS